MMMTSLTERLVEDVATVYFGVLGIATKNGVDLDDTGERDGASQCILHGRLSDALHELNPALQ